MMQNIREEITNLSAARKGSLFEHFFQNILGENAQPIRRRGIDFKIKRNGEWIGVDLKFWKKRPDPKDATPYLWLNYMTKSSMDEGVSRVYLIFPNTTKNNETPIEFQVIRNNEFEDYYKKTWKNRSETLTESINRTNSSNELSPKELASRFVKAQFPNERIRVMARDHRSMYKCPTMAPEIIPDNLNSQERIKARFQKTLAFVYKDEIFTEVWTIDHKKDWEKIKNILKDDGLNRGKKRILGDNFPKELKTKLNIHFNKILNSNFKFLKNIDPALKR